MDAREAAAGQVGGDDASTTRMGAVALPIGVVLIAISEIFHPSREDPMNFPAVFREYAQSNVWTTVHLGEYFGFLFLLGGLVALYYSVSARPGAGAGLAPFGLAAAVGEVPGCPEASSVRGGRGGEVDRDRDEQPLLLPCGTDSFSLRACHRAR
jgi:hypothetical protein